MININKDQLEILLGNYIVNNPARDKDCRYILGELSLVINEERNIINIRYKVITESKTCDFEDIEVIEYTFRKDKDMSISKQSIKQLEKQLYIHFDVLAFIYSML